MFIYLFILNTHYSNWKKKQTFFTIGPNKRMGWARILRYTIWFWAFNLKLFFLKKNITLQFVRTLSPVSCDFRDNKLRANTRKKNTLKRLFRKFSPLREKDKKVPWKLLAGGLKSSLKSFKMSAVKSSSKKRTNESDSPTKASKLKSSILEEDYDVDISELVQNFNTMQFYF